MLSMGKSTISMAIFNSFLTRGYQIRWGGYGGREYGTSEMWIESQWKDGDKSRCQQSTWGYPLQKWWILPIIMGNWPTNRVTYKGGKATPIWHNGQKLGITTYRNGCSIRSEELVKRLLNDGVDASKMRCWSKVRIKATETWLKQVTHTVNDLMHDFTGFYWKY